MQTSPRRRDAAAARTRNELIAAGLRLAESTSLSELRVDLIVVEAGVSKGTFFHHFTNRVGYLVALHQEFHDRLDAELLRTIDAMPPGASRLRRGSEVYLDGCLRDRGARALLLEARAEPAVREAVSIRNDAAARLCTPDFEAIGWTPAYESAELWVRLVAEAALLELSRHRRDPRTRAALSNFLPTT